MLSLSDVDTGLARRRDSDNLLSARRDFLILPDLKGTLIDIGEYQEATSRNVSLESSKLQHGPAPLRPM